MKLATSDILSLLTSDSRFTRNGVKFQQACNQLSEVFCQESIVSELQSSFKSMKNIAFFLNLLQYANKKNDSLSTNVFTAEQVLQIAQKGFYEVIEYVNLTESDLKDFLKDSYIDYKDLEINQVEDKKSKFLADLLSQNKEDNDPFPVKATKSIQIKQDDQYWSQSVRLDFPYIPQPDGSKIITKFQQLSNQYCIYGESVLPWNQSQITAVTDVNQFSDSDILKLFPEKRLYTRSPYMYQPCEGLEYDEDLGVIFPIKGFNKRQIKKNIIEYPHLVFLDRWVKQKGKSITIPFWKHIEIEGEIVPTKSVWDELPDTKKLPKTESFMNEYVTRRYILECSKGIEHKYPMRGTLEPFLTLYANPSYYEDHGYNPIEIGRKCVQSRASFKKSRNPILNMMNISE